jgi:predicted amidohydrolase YtcJ
MFNNVARGFSLARLKATLEGPHHIGCTPVSKGSILSPSVDLLLHNARVITLDQSQPRAEMVAIKGNCILQVGREEGLASFKGVKTRVIDCQGKTIVPGFNDAHCHPLGLAASLFSVDCTPSSVRSIADLQAKIRQRAEQTPKGKWIRAMGYNEFYLTEKRHPNKRDLDKAAPHHPVKLSHRSGHACVLNSLALKLLGISGETPEPPGGIMERDLETGEPNGLLLEMNPYVEKSMPPLSEEELEKGVGLVNEEFLSYGITSLQDATWSDGLERWQILRGFKEREKLAPRVSMMIGIDDLEEFKQRGLSRGSGDSQLRLGGVKVILQTTAGSLNPPQEVLSQLVHKAHQAGFQLALHAVEESTVEAAITALEYALSQTPKSDHRHRLEHCSVCPPKLVQRLRNTKAMIVTQPPFIYYNGERYLATVPPNDLNWLYPIGSLLNSGLRVAASSDAPVAGLNPLVGIYAAVTRAAETGQTLLPQEGISRLEALKMYTLGAAYASFEEGVKGCIAPGKLADLVVLSDDPTKVPSEAIKEIEVVITIVDGKVVWQR